MLPGPGSGPGSVLCMIRERHVILKTAFHYRLRPSPSDKQGWQSTCLSGFTLTELWIIVFKPTHNVVGILTFQTSVSIFSGRGFEDIEDVTSLA